MVPDTPVQASTSAVTKLDLPNIDQPSKIQINPSMPIFQGSIVRIEQYKDDQNTSDLIVRVPNFQRLSRLSKDIENKPQTRTKRRAPICPVLSTLHQGNNPNALNTNIKNNVKNVNINQSQVASTSRLATGLRSLSRAFTYGCRSRRSSSITDLTHCSALPDVEVMKEKMTMPITPRKPTKLVTPKILFIKRKHFKIKKKPPLPSVSIDTQTDLENNQVNRKPTSSTTINKHSEVKKSDHTKATSFLEPFMGKYDSSQQMNIIEEDNNKEQQDSVIKLNYEGILN